jgi:hypothetical protein
VTEATKPLSMGTFEPAPSYHPPAGPGVDTSPWLWVSAGLAALLVGTWLLAVGGSAGGAVTAFEDAPPPPTDESNMGPLGNNLPTLAPPTAAPSGEPEVAEEAKAVPVHVRSDVEDAVLLVNGESHGPLATGDGQTLDLPPGAYRIEAQSHGNIAAAEEVNVKPDAPVDVFLHLPAAANGSAKTAAATKAAEPAAPSGETAQAPSKPAAQGAQGSKAPGTAAAPAPTPAADKAPDSAASQPAAATATPKAPLTAAPNPPEPLAAPGSSRAAPPGGSTAAAGPVHKAVPPQAPRAQQPQAPRAPAPAQTQPSQPQSEPQSPPSQPRASSAPTQTPPATEPAPQKPDSPIPANPF